MMSQAKQKDSILKWLFDSGTKPKTTVEISNNLAISHHSVVTYCLEMQNDGYLNLVKISSLHTYEREYSCKLTEPGKHFYLTSSYHKLERQKWWMNAPKKYWWVAGLFTLFTFYVTNCSKQKQKQAVENTGDVFKNTGPGQQNNNTDSGTQTIINK